MVLHEHLREQDEGAHTRPPQTGGLTRRVAHTRQRAEVDGHSRCIRGYQPAGAAVRTSPSSCRPRWERICGM